MRANLERVVTWTVRILLIPPAVVFAWNALRDIPYLLVATPDQNIISPAAECALAALLAAAIFSSSPPCRSGHLKVLITWVASSAALLLNFFLAFIVVSLSFGRPILLHSPATETEEVCIFAGWLALSILEINLVERVTKRKLRRI